MSLRLLSMVWLIAAVMLPAVQAQTLVAAKFRKSHAASGAQDLPIDITKSISGAVSVEPRASGAGHQVVFQFDTAVTSVGSASATNANMTAIGNVAMPSFSGNEVVVTISGIGDNSRVTVGVQGVNGSANATVAVGFLLGDTDFSGSVSTGDTNAIKLRTGQSGASPNAQFDLNLTSQISAADIASAKANLGRTLPLASNASLRVVRAGTGSGSVTSTPGGIACPATTCMADFMLGSSVNLSSSANVGSTFTGWSGGCSGMASPVSITLHQGLDCVANFAAQTYSVTPSAGANGNISPATVQTVNHGSAALFTVTPNAGFTASVGGTCGGVLTGTTYTTNAITAPCSVSVTFNASLVTVTPSAGTNGSISPSTPQSVPFGTTRSFTLSPAANYTASVGGTCGGTLSGNTYTTNPVVAACTVVASFTRLSYTVTPSAGANGTISPTTPQTVLSGATKTFTVTPSTGFSSIMGGTCGGTLTGTSFVTSPVIGNCSVVATFASNTPKYVATTGNDTTGTGTSANPWRTIGKGISMLVSGETLIVRNGTYTGSANFIRNVPAGTAGRYTNVQAESPMQVRIQSTDVLGVADNQLNLANNYIKVDGFIFDMGGTIDPAHIGVISGGFNTLSRSIFKRAGDIDATGGLLQVTGSDTLIEDVAGTGACRYCFTQGGASTTTQRNIWRRVLGRFDYSNSALAKATFATEGASTAGNVKDHLYQNVIAIDGQNPGPQGGAEKMGGFHFSQNTSGISLQGSMVLNEAAGSAGAFLRELGSNNSATNTVIWDVPNSLPSAVGIIGGSGDALTIGGILAGPATDLLTPATSSLLKPVAAPANLLNNTPGAIITKQYGVSGTRWGQTGYNQLTAVDLWPWPYQDIIKAVFREANNVPMGNSPTSNDTTRGFAANITALYGGPSTLSSYIWEYLGSPCPSPACTVYTVTPSVGSNGTVSPSTPQSVPPGGTMSFTITPATGYVASIGGTCVGTLSGATYTTAPINNSCTLSVSFNQGQVFYVSNIGNNANSCTTAKSIATPKQTIQSALACLAPGDTLIIRDGTYSGTANALTNLPNGNATNFITIKAETEGNVILTSALEMAHTNAYIIMQGLRFHNSTEKTILGNHLKFFRNEFKGGCSFGNCANTTVGTNDFNDTADILLEDNWWHGAGARYNLIIYNANRVVVRRGVIRHDGGWTDDKDDPEAGINFYNSSNCSAQNVIVLDSNLAGYHTWQSAFYSVFNNASPNATSNNSWLGIIALNNSPPGFSDGAGLRFDGNAPQANHIVQDAVLWDNFWGMNVAYASSIGVAATRLTIGQTTRGSVGYGIAGGSSGTKSFSNAIITNMNNRDFDVSGSSISFFDTFNNGSSSSGTGKQTYNPRTNGLSALMRIETGTPLKTAGSSGGQIGAQIVNRIGAAGSLQGEAGWNVDTGLPLWPFPNEARIKKEMCTDPGVTRGFCASSSLTQYIGGYLGNPSPY